MIKPSATLSPSPNWFLSSALTSSPTSSPLFAYAAKNTTVVMNNQKVIHHLRGHRKNITGV
jgi:hypothetical protein